jgi:hypothetical protein
MAGRGSLILPLGLIRVEKIKVNQGILKHFYFIRKQPGARLSAGCAHLGGKSDVRFLLSESHG